MRKTVLTAAALAMSASVAGLAYAAAPSGPTATQDSSVVSTVPSATTPGATSSSTSTPSRADDHGGDRHRGDDDSTGRRGGGHGSDD